MSSEGGIDSGRPLALRTRVAVRESAIGLCALRALGASQANSRSRAWFPLTPALSLGERENHFPFLDEPKPSLSPNAAQGRPLSPRERAGVRGECALDNLPPVLRSSRDGRGFRWDRLGLGRRPEKQGQGGRGGEGGSQRHQEQMLEVSRSAVREHGLHEIRANRICQ